jgi:hypothetical protein
MACIMARKLASASSSEAFWAMVKPSHQSAAAGTVPPPIVGAAANTGVLGHLRLRLGGVDQGGGQRAPVVHHGHLPVAVELAGGVGVPAHVLGRHECVRRA